MKSNKGYHVMPPDKGWSICEYKRTKKKRFKRHLLKNWHRKLRQFYQKLIRSKADE